MSKRRKPRVWADDIPEEFMNALHKACGFPISPQALVDAFNAWPGIERDDTKVEDIEIVGLLILPLPQKDGDA